MYYPHLLNLIQMNIGPTFDFFDYSFIIISHVFIHMINTLFNDVIHLSIISMKNLIRTSFKPVGNCFAQASPSSVTNDALLVMQHHIIIETQSILHISISIGNTNTNCTSLHY